MTFDLDKYRSVGAVSRLGHRQTREFRTQQSGVVRKTLDEAGNVTTEHSKGDRVDVHINAKAVEARLIQ